MIAIIKWFKRWGVKDLHIGALSGDDMKYVIIEDRFLDAQRMKCQDANMSKLEHYIAIVNLTTR